MIDTAAPAGMLIADDGRSLIIDVAAAAGIHTQLLVGSKMNIAAATGHNRAILGLQVIAVKITAAAGIYRKFGHSPGDIAVGSTALCNRQIAYRDLALQVTASGQVHMQLLAAEVVFYKDV